MSEKQSISAVPSVVYRTIYLTGTLDSTAQKMHLCLFLTLCTFG